MHPDRDRLVHLMVEWVMRRTDLPLGHGEGEPAEPNASVIAAWLLSGGKQYDDYTWGNSGRAELIDAAHTDLSFHAELQAVGDREKLLEQLRNLKSSTVRECYLAYRKRLPSGRASVRDDVNRAERTREALAYYDPRKSSTN